MFAPFVKYLLGQERGQLPVTWTETGKEELINELVGSPDRGEVKMTSWMETYFEHEQWCIDPGNAFERQALALVIQRGWDSFLIPLYDMINHTNDLKKRNTENSSVYDKAGLKVWASRAIEPGEEILASYDECNDCGGTSEDWGTPEILRDFGFVETYPHTFYFRGAGEEALFYVEEVTNDEDREAHRLEGQWLGYESPRYEGIDWMKEEYQRLQDLQHEGTLAKRRHLIPEKEWNTIFQYHQALTAALDAAIPAAIADLEDVDEYVDEDYDDEDYDDE
jgi:hypothetical protein